MLAEFVNSNRQAIIDCARAKVKNRSTPVPTEDELKNGVPLFLDQLVEALNRSTPTHEAIGPSAARHGGDMLRSGFTIAQVVHDYGDVCQSITELAEELHAPITIEEFNTLNRCLDDAIAEAVTEYSRLRTRTRNAEETGRLGAFGHELRNKLHSALLAYTALKGGRVGIGGSTASVLERSLRGLKELIDGSLAEVRIESGKQDWERIMLSDLVAELELDANLSADEYGMELIVGVVPRGLEVEADHAILSLALVNLLQNAFKFSRPGGHVTLRIAAIENRVVFTVEDECGGLREGHVSSMFEPFTQFSDNRTGMGLGLSISRKGIEGLGGTLTVEDIPGKGCIFSIDLPRVVSQAGLTA